MIKTKQELLNHFSDINEMYNNPFKYQTLSNMIDELLEQMESSSNKSEILTGWILCSERLPERDVDVLTYHRNESFDYQYISWIDECTGKWAGFIGNLYDEVIAWMPLPEPYKAESEET